MVITQREVFSPILITLYVTNREISKRVNVTRNMCKQLSFLLKINAANQSISKYQSYSIVKLYFRY